MQSESELTSCYMIQLLAKRPTFDLTAAGRSFINERKSTKPSTVPCGMPDFTGTQPDTSPSTNNSLGSTKQERLYLRMSTSLDTVMPELHHKDKEKDPFISPQEIVVGYAKDPELL